MSDRTKDELRKRFNESQGDDSGTTTGVSDSSGSSDSSHTGGTDETDETDEKSSSEGLKERKQVAMYLPQDHRDDLADLYDELDARSKLAGEGELEKNREFYEALVEFTLDRKGEFASTLGIELEE